MMSKFFLIFFGSFLLQTVVYSQSDDWTKEVTGNGTIVVLSKIYNEKDNSGKELLMLEYVATSIAEVELNSCIALLKDVSKQSEYVENAEYCKKIKDISENEWLIYSYLNPPWPVPNLDCVSILKFTENKTEKTAIFSSSSKPDMYEDKGVTRMIVNSSKYIFKDLGNGKVKITISAKFSPAVNAPEWLIKGWFPNGPTKIMEGIIKEAKKI